MIQNNVENNSSNFKKKKPITYAVYTILTIFAILAITVIADAALNTNKVHPGVNILGISAAGKDRKSLNSELSLYEGNLLNTSIIISYRRLSWTVSAADLDIKVDKVSTVNNAMSFGRSGSPVKRIRTRIDLWFNPLTIKPEITYSHGKMDKLFSKISKRVDKLPEDAAIKILDRHAVSTSSKIGLEVDQNSLTHVIVEGFINNARDIDLPTTVLQPDIAESDLDTTLKTVKLIVKEPIKLIYRDAAWKISSDELTDWIEFEKVRHADRWGLEAKLDKDQLVAFVEQNTKKIAAEPKDAEFKIVEDTVTIVPGSEGIMVDLDKVYDDISTACESDSTREVMLVTKTAKPKLTTDDAGKMEIKEKVSGFTTTFNPGQASRVHNIRTLAAALDGNLIAPGKEFSFNDAIGPRTAAKGYQEAPAIVNGELVPSLGGGVCQVATTLFNTIFFGGFEVTERRNHSFFISHYPTGRDATVSWGGPDLKFKNDSDSYLLIKASTTNRSITINFYGTKRNLKVEYTTAGPSNFKPSINQTINDPSLRKGVKKVEDKGFSGRDVTVIRTVYLNGTVLKKDKFFSRYTPKKTIVRVGTAAAPVVPTTQTQEGSNTTPANPEQPQVPANGGQSPTVGN